MRSYFFILITITLALSGCGDPIAKLVNDRFPPVNVDAQRQTAIDTTAEALGQLTTPNIAFAATFGDVEKALLTDALRKQGVSELELRGDNQLILVRVKFSRQFNEDDGGENPDIRLVLARLRPKVSGSIEAYLGMTGALTTDTQPLPELHLRMLPGVARVEVREINVAEKIDVTKAGEVLAGLLNTYRDNITGELTRAAFSRVTIPAAASQPFDLSQSFKVDSAGTAFKVQVKASPVTSPIKLDGVAWLVNEKGVIALIQFSPLAAPRPMPLKVNNTFNDIRHQVDNLVTNTFGVTAFTESSWVALRKELIATSLNSVAAQAGACISAVGNAYQKTESKVPMPSGDGIDCSSNRNCESDRVCTFSASKDERSCNRCLISRPVVCLPRVCAFGRCVGGGCTDGGCAQEGNDPVCELSKAGQNQIYLADANLRKADCDRFRGQETIACQAEEVGKKLLCESGKTALNALRRTGNFANVDVETNLRSDNINVCLRDFSLTPALDNVAFALDITGQANADVDVKFVPLDIFGHLACQFPWTEKQTFTAEMRESRINLNSKLNIVTTEDKAKLDFAVQEMTVKAKLSPGPTEFLMKSVNMTVACQGLNFIKPLLVTLTPFIKELRGDIDQKIDKQSVTFAVPLPVIMVGDAKVKAVARQTTQALVMSVSSPEKQASDQVTK